MMVRDGRGRLFGAALLAVAQGGAAEAAASREEVRLTLLDYCVMTEWRVRSNKDRIADECKCASARTAGALSSAQVKAFGDKLTGAAEKTWLSAAKACFRSR